MEIINRMLVVSRWPLWATGLALVLITACTQPPSIALTATPDQVLLILGDSVGVEVTMTRGGGASADVALEASGLPTGVSATFSPATLSGSTLTSTLMLSASAAATEGAATVTVTATGPGLTATSQVELEVDSLDVTGSVRGILEEPLAGLTVYIPGHPPTVSAADGSFTIAGVAVPYDLTVASGAEWAQTFVGLSTPTPEAQPFFATLTAPQLPTATVTGDLTGPFSPVPAGFRILICPEGLDKVVWANPSCETVFPGETVYSVDIVWAAGTAADVRLRAYAYQLDASSVVTAIVGSTALTVSLTDGFPLDNDLAIVASDPSWADLELTASGPPGADISAQVVTHINDQASYVNFSSAILSAPVQLVAPFLSDAEYTVVASASTAAFDSSIAWETGLTSGDSVTLALPAAPTSISPAAGATGVTEATVFATNNPHGGSTHFVFSPLAPPTGPLWFVSTSESAITVPDLSAIGIAMSPASQYGWQVLTTPQTDGADGMVTASGYLGAYLEVERSLRGGPAPTGDGALYVTAQRSFTTQ